MVAPMVGESVLLESGTVEYMSLNVAPIVADKSPGLSSSVMSTYLLMEGSVVLVS